MQAILKPGHEYYDIVESGKIYMRIQMSGRIFFLLKRKGEGPVHATNFPLHSGKILSTCIGNAPSNLHEYIWVRENECIIKDINTNASAVALLKK